MKLRLACSYNIGSTEHVSQDQIVPEARTLLGQSFQIFYRIYSTPEIFIAAKNGKVLLK